MIVQLKLARKLIYHVILQYFEVIMIYNCMISSLGVIDPVCFWIHRSALMLACESDSVETVEALLRGGANTQLVDVFGHTATDYSVTTGNQRILQMLQDGVPPGTVQGLGDFLIWRDRRDWINMNISYLCEIKWNKWNGSRHHVTAASKRPVDLVFSFPLWLCCSGSWLVRCNKRK